MFLALGHNFIPAEKTFDLVERLLKNKSRLRGVKQKTVLMIRMDL